MGILNWSRRQDDRCPDQRTEMKAAALAVLWLGMPGTSTEALAASCSSYYISEITLVSAIDTEAGRVPKEEAEKNALGSCSHIQQDLQTCLDSDRMLGRNAASDTANGSLHLKYTKAVRRITGCD
jgi:hypothetical protein